MSTRVRAPVRELRAQARVRLIAIAERLVDTGLAYSTISVERLTREAGMPRTRFYSYFDDKADLLLAWFDSARPEIEDATAKWSGLQRVNSNQQLRSVLRELLDAHRVRRSLFAAMSEGAPTDPRLQSAYEQLLQTIALALREHIERGQREGWIDPGLLSAGTADWLIWGWERNASMVSDWATDAEIARSLDGFTSFVWGALYRCAADTVSD
ncbi:TetR/AcrR family transcriptional regulator [Mycobacterium sp.]|uniref:TetR/AcrR family transcriptional regulator n=1 Tax=Mycobacterium sp. TaxID=1785 RepID=UPI0025E78692|nr:TetR/AcrR family transcriptional regulator [Mycobacterium sp.]